MGNSARQLILDNQKNGAIPSFETPARMFHELLWRDHEDGRATGQPQGVGSEVYLNGTSQVSTPEDARKYGHIHGRSKPFTKHPGSGDSFFKDYI